MSRAAALLLLLLAASPAAALAEPGASPSEPSQLDRIERKLDTLLQHLDQLQGQGTLPATPGSAPSGSPPAPVAQPDGAAPLADRPGALLVLHPAPERLQDLATPAPDSVGGFVYAGGSLQLDDLSSRGVRYRGLAALELQGWLMAEQAGRHQLGAEVTATAAHGLAYLTTCRLEAWLEDRSLGSQQAETRVVGDTQTGRLTLVLGAELRPGLYKLRLSVACTRERPGQHIAVELLEKTPTDLNLRGLTQADLIHKEG